LKDRRSVAAPAFQAISPRISKAKRFARGFMAQVSFSAASQSGEAEPYARIAVVGAGAWGTALAAVAANAGREVLLWAREPEVVDSINAAHMNRRFLDGVDLPAAIAATGEMARVREAGAILVVAPAQYARETLTALRGHVASGTPVVACAKGVEQESGLLLSEVLVQVMPRAEPAILSGPSFARDVAHGKPTAVTIAAREGVAARLQATLAHNAFRPYVTDDLAGVALGGAAKNVYAIATGMVHGAGMGESARAAVLARGFAELMRLGAGVGARGETLMGLSGLGDLVLTATSMSSRNFAYGVALGKGARPDDVAGEGKPLAEGAATAPALIARARREGIELPIAEAVADVLAGRLDVARAAERLLARPLKAETGPK
jgi:glycerol-3-phosphate dehydrogenase (NAD(P)+)